MEHCDCGEEGQAGERGTRFLTAELRGQRGHKLSYGCFFHLLCPEKPRQQNFLELQKGKSPSAVERCGALGTASEVPRVESPATVAAWLCSASFSRPAGTLGCRAR